MIRLLRSYSIRARRELVRAAVGIGMTFATLFGWFFVLGAAAMGALVVFRLALRFGLL